MIRPLYSVHCTLYSLVTKYSVVQLGVRVQFCTVHYSLVTKYNVVQQSVRVQFWYSSVGKYSAVQLGYRA